MTIPLGRLIVYTKRIQEMADFYCRHFGFEVVHLEGDRIVELLPQGGGSAILLHPASKGQKEGQSLIKFVFDVEDVVSFCRIAETRGLHFGPTHQADGYVFANTKDPSNNSVSVSNRVFSN